MATLEGARALGWEDLIGSLEKGKRADLISVCLPGSATDADADPDGRSCWADPVESLVARATASDVRMVMVDGRLAYGSFEPGDPEVITESAPRSATVAAAYLAVRAKLGL
jgi:cytosine/adenosine deaminase-related metal-dependent hydrolase